MNKQKTAKGRGIEWTDYTWNPVRGCQHGCRWTMPDGTIAKCYSVGRGRTTMGGNRCGVERAQYLPA